MPTDEQFLQSQQNQHQQRNYQHTSPSPGQVRLSKQDEHYYANTHPGGMQTSRSQRGEHHSREKQTIQKDTVGEKQEPVVQHTKTYFFHFLDFFVNFNFQFFFQISSTVSFHIHISGKQKKTHKFNEVQPP